MTKLIECVPNFSEGRNPEIIGQITTAIETVKGIRLLHVDSGFAANRTVVTFAGSPETVLEAAFRGIQKAAELIDMQTQTGEHPRFGACDVCPIVPIAHVSMEEAVGYSLELAKRVGNELGIPVYCYEKTAFTAERQSLAACRKGGYEALKTRMANPNWKPDFGLEVWSEKVAKSGAIAIGARNFLVAFNINLNTTSSKIAEEIAGKVRESGKTQCIGVTSKGEIARDDRGIPIRIPGSLKKTKAIGWYIKEFGKAQVSMNLCDTAVTPLHLAFEEVSRQALLHGVRVTGSELVGLIPLQSMIDAGTYFLQKQNRSNEIPRDEIIEVAIDELGLSEISLFEPQKRILEFLLNKLF